MISIINWLVLATTMGLVSGEPRPETNAENYIRALTPEQRSDFIVKYSASGWNYSGFIKFQLPPKTYLHCPRDGCDPNLPGLLADLRSRVPGAYGDEVSEADAAQIEIHVAEDSTDFDKRDLQVDKELHIDAQVGSKFLHPLQSAPCRATIYFDQQHWAIKKSMIFIDSDASSRMQSLCMGFELVRAIGAINIPLPLFYRELERRPTHDPLPYLAANVFLHMSPDIHAGDSMDKALAILKDRYDVQ